MRALKAATLVVNAKRDPKMIELLNAQQVDVEKVGCGNIRSTKVVI
jgi:hypothetical protein